MTAKTSFQTVTLALLLILFAGFAAAEELPEKDSLRELISTRNAGQLLRLIGRQKERDRAAAVCRIQLKNSRIPLHCFRRRPSSASGDTVWLADLCSRRAAESSDQSELERLLGDRLIPQKCKDAARSRLGDLLYIDKSQRPEEYFRHSHLSSRVGDQRNEQLTNREVGIVDGSGVE